MKVCCLLVKIRIMHDKINILPIMAPLLWTIHWSSKGIPFTIEEKLAQRYETLGKINSVTLIIIPSWVTWNSKKTVLLTHTVQQKYINFLLISYYQLISLALIQSFSIHLFSYECLCLVLQHRVSTAHNKYYY